MSHTPYMLKLFEVGEQADALEKAIIELDSLANDARVPPGVRAKMCVEVRLARESIAQVTEHLTNAVWLECHEGASS